MTNRQIKLLQRLQTKRGRRKTGFFLVEGLRCCREAMERCPERIEFALGTESFTDGEGMELALALGTRLERVPDSEFMRFTATENPQGILLVVQTPEPPEATLQDPFVLILDQIQEPGNLGTILRTAWAIGLHSVWLLNGCTDPFGPKAIRSGMGAQFALALPEFPDLAMARDELHNLGGKLLWLAVPSRGINCYSEEFSLGGNALVIGNEANGISDLSLGTGVTIPMPGRAESLNAAQAATILLFEGVRRNLFHTCPPAT